MQSLSKSLLNPLLLDKVQNLSRMYSANLTVVDAKMVALDCRNCDSLAVVVVAHINRFLAAVVCMWFVINILQNCYTSPLICSCGYCTYW